MIKPTCDRKTKGWKGQKNTYGLFPADGCNGTCPGATKGPGGCLNLSNGRYDCYVFKIMRIYKGVENSLLNNTTVLRMADFNGKKDILRTEFNRFRTAELKRTEPRLFYRLHWSGDIFDREYAKALAAVIQEFPDIKFWGYTRSFEFAEELVDIPNLVMYLSIDAVNREAGLALAARRPGKFALAYLAEVQPDKSYLPCPVDSKKMALEEACQKCKICISGHKVWFKTKRG